MVLDTPLTTRQVADLCHVSTVAVWKWIKAGKLKASQSANGRYGVEPAALRAFLSAGGLPIPDELKPGKQRRILVIDDEPAVIEVVARTLGQIGDLIVATASDGFEAGLQTATFRPDLLVLDLMMPGMDGFQVCRTIKQTDATAHIKVLVISAYGSHENIDRALDAGADVFLHKPIEIGEFQSAVLGLLGRSD